VQNKFSVQLRRAVSSQMFMYRFDSNVLPTTYCFEFQLSTGPIVDNKIKFEILLRCTLCE